MEYDLENPLISNGDDSISDIFDAESDHMSPFAGNLNRSSRQDAVSLILQSGKPWIIRLLAIACFSLASRMKKVDFNFTDSQRDEGFIFDAQTIHRMEMLVLGALEWRMRSITPFCFIDYFMSLANQPPYLEALKNRAHEMLFKAQNEIKILEFKPSLIAASALLSAANDLLPIQLPSFRSAIESSIFVDKRKLTECLSVMMKDVVMDGYDSMFEMISVHPLRCSAEPEPFLRLKAI